MNICDEIRFKVKSINFTQITNTAKGMQATMTTTAHLPSSSSAVPTGGPPNGDELQRPVRQRSSSVGIDESKDLPPVMHIVASICEDGLGLTSWWEKQDSDEDDDDEEEGADT